MPQVVRRPLRPMAVVFAAAALVAPLACVGVVGSATPGACAEGASEYCHPSPALAGKGACVPGWRACRDGNWGECVGAGMPSPESCDAMVDEDCDGTIDEGCPCDAGTTRPCYTGGAASQGKGACRAGIAECVDGAWGSECIGEVLPSGSESCDGVDDDCDGSVDEGCTCETGATAPCYPFAEATKGIGACQAGQQSCAGGTWGDCVGAVGPAPEACNGVDDDCDGKADEGNPEGGGACSSHSSGACSAGVVQCSGGMLVCVEGSAGGSETCNGVDDDCDGQIDEGDPGGGTACDTGVPGSCGPGVVVCSGGALACASKVGPTPEACNGVDDDCDGQTDEGDPGGGKTCDTGKLGACAEGVLHCVDASLSCQALKAPAQEACNAVDDDCDGVVDDGNPGGGAPCETPQLGPCQPGTTSCVGGTVLCLQNVFAGVEFCNGLDDDCTGVEDDFVSDCPGQCFFGNCYGDIP